MSGKKQHYIPKVLLKGFRANQKGAYGQAFVLKSIQPPYLASIADIAAQRFFYSDISTEGEETLDDRITVYENRLALLLKSLLDTQHGHMAEPLIAAEVVAHLSARGAYLRDIFSSGVGQLVEGFSATWKVPETARAALQIDDRNMSSMFWSCLSAEVEKLKPHLPASFPTPLLQRLLRQYVREDFANLHGEISPSINGALTNLLSLVPESIRNSHTNALDSTLVPDERVAGLATLCWRVYRSDSHLVLPDCVAISLSSDGSSVQPYMMERLEEVGSVMLPIAKDMILFGCRQDAEFDESKFNQHAARCSTTFFVSSEDSEQLRELSRSIGDTTHGAVSSIVSEVLAGSLTRSERESSKFSATSNDGEGPGARPKAGRERPSGRASYTVNFKDCADQEQAEAIAHEVGCMVGRMAKFLELDHLKAVIFSSDYESALCELDAQLAASVGLETTDVPGLVGVASMANEYVDGQLRSYIVMRGYIGHALLAEAEEGARVARHLLSSMLSQISFARLLEGQFGDASARARYRPWDALLFKPMDGTPVGYYSAWTSADIDPEAADTYRMVARTTLAHASSVIRSERQAYQVHGDIDRLISLATDALGAMLVAIAKLVGHCDACNTSIYEGDSEFKEELERQGMIDWISLFSRDLREVFASRGRWRSEKDLMSLGDHMERQLWRYSIFPWEMDDGRVRIEVPCLPSDSLPQA